MSQTPFRQLFWIEITFIVSLFLLWLADHSSVLGGLFNPHTAIGGGVFLFLFGIAAVSFFALLVIVPWACVVVFRKPVELMRQRLILTTFGLLELILLGVWLANILFFRR